MADLLTHGHRHMVLRGIAWVTLYHVFEVIVAFGAMLVLVRIIPPAEYGRAGAVVGLLTLLNAFGCATFMAQALQLADGEEPDWSLHWSAGFYIQGALALLGNVMAGLCWFQPAYRPIAPLMHLAALGLILDLPNWVGSTMLQRAMDLRRLQLLNGVITLGSAFVALAVGLAGGGAYAVVLSSNVTRGLPVTFDLLVVRRWRPRAGWWRWPDWVTYRPALRFGFQRAGSVLLHAARGALEAAVLPGAVGFGAIGLLGRAQALFSTTVGRVAGILVETVYPLLPRYAANRSQYPRQATLFAQVICLLMLPGALYIGLEGPSLSRLLYGRRWVEADPLILPAAIIGAGQVMILTASRVLLAANRLRVCLLLDVVVAALGVPMIVIAWLGAGLSAYAWAVAAGQLVAGMVALSAASSLLTPDWIRRALLPPVLAGFLAVSVVLTLQSWDEGWPLGARLGINTCAYWLTFAVILRGLFPRALATALGLLPGGDRMNRWLGLQTTLAVAPP